MMAIQCTPLDDNVFLATASHTISRRRTVLVCVCALFGLGFFEFRIFVPFESRNFEQLRKSTIGKLTAAPSVPRPLSYSSNMVEQAPCQQLHASAGNGVRIGISPENDQTMHDDRECRICFGGEDVGGVSNILISPCKCTGGQKFVHVDCLASWQEHVLASQETVDTRWKVCAVCKSVFNFTPPSLLFERDANGVIALSGGDAASLRRAAILLGSGGLVSENQRNAARDVLLRLLKKGSVLGTRTRQQAAFSLGVAASQGDVVVMRALMDRVEKDNVIVALAAGQALGKVAQEDQTTKAALIRLFRKLTRRAIVINSLLGFTVLGFNAFGNINNRIQAVISALLGIAPSGDQAVIGLLLSCIQNTYNFHLGDRTMSAVAIALGRMAPGDEATSAALIQVIRKTSYWRRRALTGAAQLVIFALTAFLCPMLPASLALPATLLIPLVFAPLSIPLMQSYAAHALCRTATVGNQNVIRALLGLVERDSSVSNILGYLARGDKPTIDALIRLLHNERQQTRRNAAVALAGTAPTDDASTIGALIDRIQKENHLGVVIAMGEALGRLVGNEQTESTIATLIHFLDNPDPKIRRNAAVCLSNPKVALFPDTILSALRLRLAKEKNFSVVCALRWAIRNNPNLLPH